MKDLAVTIDLRGALLLGKGPEIVSEEMEAALYEATAYMERQVKKKTPQGVFGAKGGLLSTIYGEVEGKGTRVVKGVVGHQSKYGDVIEHGRRPGKAWPPEGTLIRWIEETFGVDELVAQRLEFVIRRKIGKKGFPGAFMFRDALDEGWPTLERIFQKHGFAIARKLNN